MWFAVGVVAVIVAGWAVYIALAYTYEPNTAGQAVIGADYRYYRDLGARWLLDGQYYLPEQLQGPYDQVPGTTVLYPPTALFLFVPFAVLPAVLWYAVPIALLLGVLVSWKPEPWAWLVMLGLLAFPHAIGAYLFGNTDMWAVAFIALGLRFGWPAVLLAVKPLYLPFALVGVRRRSFWVAAVLLGVASLPMLPLWFDYYRAMTDMRVDASYWLQSVPLLCLPLVGWLGRREIRQPGLRVRPQGIGPGVIENVVRPVEDRRQAV